ncbi:hypothetical protein QBC33DRAFT_189589 [Phialemonium atrogriseum]|uniref:NTF2-like domain-containing protein n=1 Tax=Phialemonium atrogriseum TaxID=1093897 RepID=A0AAJ0FKZ1_9PEZI|nr:uncharacterized protein QBC33DRAFT_189589 [Phialemonium atrogriseum]KAK1764580.1 hypothetical protein QBC33DRAFT_189589 [Phialemonium atrogriseum]
MFFSSLVTAAALASSALAMPSPWRAWKHADACLTRDEATAMVDVYKNLISAYKDADCEKYCHKDFADYSDSINTFLNQPLGGPTFATKDIFMAAQNENPPFPLVVDSIDAVDCTVIALRWHATFGEANLPNKGITVLQLSKDSGDWQIKLIDTEFNALTWLRDMGGSYDWEGKTYGPEADAPPA